MRITILSRSASIPSTRRLVEAGRARGHRMRVVNPGKIKIFLDGRQSRLYLRGKRLRRADVVIPRIAESMTHHGLAVVNQLGTDGVPLMNSAQAIAQARNKVRSMQLLSANGIDIPATVMARDAADLPELVKLVGGVPVLVKLLHGSERHGVMVCESLQSLAAAVEAVVGLGHSLVVQQYVRSKTGRDVRVLVVGGEAVAAVRRRPRVGRLARTLLQGARLEKIELTEAQRRTAVETARLVGLEVAAVDLLDVGGVPKVFEVNSSPALTEMEAATGVDLAAAIISRAEVLATQAQPRMGRASAPPALKSPRARPG